MKSLVEAWNNNGTEAFAIATATALGIYLVIIAARWIVARAIGAVSRRARSPVGESVAGAIAATKLWLMLPLAIYLASSSLDLPERPERVLALAAVVGLLLQAGLWASRMIRDWLARKATTHAGDAVTALALLGLSARIAVWVMVFLVILDHMGFNITALVAGLGIGGVAVALAVQNILGDLFASLSIVLDKPFAVGDFIVVDNMRGTVERVGVKSTRVRSLDGEILVFSNSELLKSRIRNFKRLTERRVLFSVGVTYDTPIGEVRSIPAMLREIVEAREKTRFDRAHFREFADSALTFEVVYFVLAAEFNTYVDIHQAINLEILERFASRGIQFAFPTRTLHVATAPPLNVTAGELDAEATRESSGRP